MKAMKKPYILCVDDEKIVTDSLVAQLRSTLGEAYDYEAASSVQEAWEVLADMEAEGAELHMVVSDWLMPKVKGDELLREIYAQNPTPALIMLSGQADDDAIRQLEGIVPGFVFMRKPWDRQELMTLIKSKLQAIPV